MISLRKCITTGAGSQVLKSCLGTEQSMVWCPSLALLGLQSRQGIWAGVQSPSGGSAEGYALPRCGKEGTGPWDGLAEGAAALAASSNGKVLDKAKAQLKAVLAPVKPCCLSGLFPSQHAPCCCTSRISAGGELR